MPLISQQSLTTQLRELERDGVVRRQVYAEVPARVEYSLSDVGRKISPLMSSLMAWDMNSSSCASPRNPGYCYNASIALWKRARVASPCIQR